jgi:putative endonuclease
MFFVYILQNKNGKTYTGYTSKDVAERLAEHNGGCNTFTKYYKPWKLVYYEQFTCEKCARNREKFLKTGVGKKIVKILVENFEI